MLGGGRCPTNGTVCAPRCAQVRRGTTWARARGVCACWLRNAAAHKSIIAFVDTIRRKCGDVANFRYTAIKFAESLLPVHMQDSWYTAARTCASQCAVFSPSDNTTRPAHLVLLRKPPVRLYTPILQLACLLHDSSARHVVETASFGCYWASPLSWRLVLPRRLSTSRLRPGSKQSPRSWQASPRSRRRSSSHGSSWSSCTALC